MAFGDRLRKFREERGFTQEQLAERIGVAKTTITGYERGNRQPDVEKIKKLAHALSITGDELLDTGLGNKIAPLYSSEALEIAKTFDSLDGHGQGAVRAILNFEHASVIAEARQAAVPGKLDLKVTKRSDGFCELHVYDQPAAAGLGNYLDDPAFHIEQYPANEIPDGTDFGIRISGDSMSPEIPNSCTVFVQSRSSVEPGKIGIFLLNGEAFCKKLAVDRAKGQIRLVSLNPAYQDRIIEECDDFHTMGVVLGHWPR